MRKPGRIPLVGPFVLAVVVLALTGCGGPKTGPAEEVSELPEFDLTADAYLFDARVYRDKKPASVRLEIYYTDSLVGLGARAYLGKGALKGWLTEDSLLVYFPASNEYVYEPIATLLESDRCPGSSVRVPLAGLLSTTPDSLNLAGDLKVESDYGNANEPEFVITAGDCPWRIEIKYDRHDNRWLVDHFRFDNGSGLTLTAGRRTVKLGASVSSRRFSVAIPTNAQRVIP